MIPGNTPQEFFGAAANAAAAGGYSIDRSLRFNSADSAYLNRTPASVGNRRTFTWAAWIKRSSLATSDQYIFGAYGTKFEVLRFEPNTDRLQLLLNGGSAANLITTQVFRDFSAWMHLTLAVDTTQGTASNRIKLYVNGTQVTTFSTSTYPSQNYDSDYNNTVEHQLGALLSSGFYNGYLADIYFIDGTALTPSAFGETDATTGVWVPKAFTGTYGTNGFKLNFSNNSATTAATLGADTSGNGNNWTPNNFSVTAGAGNDSLRDSPTNGTASTGGDAGGVTVGNYCTLNPLITVTGTLSNGNLDYSSGAQYRSAFSTFAVTTGKWYFEGTVTNFVADALIGVAYDTLPSSSYVGSNATSWAYEAATPAVFNNGAGTSFGNTYTTNDIIGVAFDADTGKLWFAKNGTWQGSGNPGGGTNPAVTVTTGKTYFFGVSGGNGGAWSTNWGARAFAYAAPSGYKALCTANLTAPTIVKPSTVFDVKTYTGNGSTQTISGLGFSPDLVWLKNRATGDHNGLFDTQRGALYRLVSDYGYASTLRANTLTAFNSDGFSVGSASEYNGSTNGIVAWAWEENISCGFDIVTFTGNGSNRTVSHSLGVAPSLILVKDTSSGTNFGAVYHSSVGNTAYLKLFDDASGTAASTTDSTVWNNTSPTSSVFSVGTSSRVNANGNTIIAYCWAPVAGYSAFGSYTGNGSSDGPFVYTGFRPAYVLIKGSTSITSWNIVDNKRLGYNADNYRLFAESSSAENATGILDFTSNGFKIRNTGGDYNDNAQTYIYAAFAESPFGLNNRAR